MSLILFAAFLSFAAAAAIAGAEVLRPRRELRAALGRLAPYGGETEAPRRGSLADAVAATAAAFGARVGRHIDLEAIAGRLAAAGAGDRIAPETYVAIRAAAAGGGALAGVVLGLVGGSATRALVAAASFALVGALAPDRVLALRAQRRREEIQVTLPDALDLLAVSVEAGLGLDAAIAKVAEATDGALADEFGLLLGEIRLGTARSEALERMAERVAVAELTAFARAIARSDKLGTSLARTLRFQAAEARFRRQAAAEEAAGKAPVKMLFPTVLLIFPALFVVVLGPALLMLKEIF